MIDPTLYVILDRGVARGRDLLELLAAAVAGGCRMVQLRDKEAITKNRDLIVYSNLLHSNGA